MDIVALVCATACAVPYCRLWVLTYTAPCVMTLMYHDSTVTYRYETRLANAFTFGTYSSSVPLPASGPVCEPPPPLAPNTPTRCPRRRLLITIWTRTHSSTVPVPGLTSGLAARSLGFSNLLKKFCGASYRDILGRLPIIGDVDVGAPAHAFFLYLR